VNSTLPASLIEFKGALEDAVRRDLGRSRARRTTALRSALAAAAVAAVALGALSLASRHPGGGSVVDRAAAAIARSPGTILHVDMHGSQTNGDGSIIRWRDESWEQQSPPYDGRKIQTAPNGATVETATKGGQDEVYDAARDTIYIAPRVNEKPYAMDHYDLKPGPRPGTALLRMGDVKAGRIVSTAVITTAQAKGLRTGTYVIGLKISSKSPRRWTVTVMPTPSVPKPSPSSDDASEADPTSSGFRGQILALLRSGEARVVGKRTIDGQDAIEIASADGHTTYYVDPGTYRPLELDTRGTNGGTALHFRTYETLDLGANRTLLSLTARHPDARIDRDPADYNAAQERLFPNG
jgi:hypothetical protein